MDDQNQEAESYKAFNIGAWLVEGAVGVVNELKHSNLALSPEFWEHAHCARRESLLAARAVLDQLINCTEKCAGEDGSRERRKQRRGNISIS